MQIKDRQYCYNETYEDPEGMFQADPRILDPSQLVQIQSKFQPLMPGFHY